MTLPTLCFAIVHPDPNSWSNRGPHVNSFCRAALNILDVIGCLRLSKDADLKVQLDVFEEELAADTDAMRDAAKDANAINLNSHHDLFKTIYSKVNDSSLGLSFLSILYNLYQIDPNSSHSESTWILIERLTQKAVEGAVEANRLMEEAKMQKRYVDVSVQTQESSPPSSGSSIKRRSLVRGRRPGSVSETSVDPTVSPIVTPDPNCRMKHFTWNKVPALQVQKTSIWDEVNKMDDSIPVEYDRLKELFAHKVIQPQESKAEEPTLKIRASSSEISLLDPKRSMNVNIYLKQFRKNNAAIVDMVRKGEARNIGVEKLKGLIKILPPSDEIELIQSFDGDPEKLGNAEKFFLKLMSVPQYKLRLELMLLRSDFQSQLSNVRSNLAVLTSLCRRLQDNKGLKKFLRLVLHAGNYINKGSSSGAAVGFRVSSLNKLALTKSNDPSLSLLHVLVEEASANDKDCLEFADNLLDDLHKASRFSVEQVKTEFNQIKNTVKKLQSQMSSNPDAEITAQFGDFLEEADGDLIDVEEVLDRLQNQTTKLAQHYCENINSFHLEEFFGAFREFCDRIKVCQQEIQSKKLQAEKAEQRKKAHEEMLEKRRGSTSVNQHQKEQQRGVPAGAFKLPGLGGSLGPAGPGDSKIVDNLVNEIRRGNVLRRLSVRRKMNPVPDMN
ncbi:inverted formin-2 [Elysia marginata]|uniref:Inverted formin-2 n=1 Tax=Elysia marginata TaxID=1093978 RepID=A0AAV4GJE1_9GAST|nr:inverted formin-2 [Elysia marginata]